MVAGAGQAGLEIGRHVGRDQVVQSEKLRKTLAELVGWRGAGGGIGRGIDNGHAIAAARRQFHYAVGEIERRRATQPGIDIVDEAAGRESAAHAIHGIAAIAAAIGIEGQGHLVGDVAGGIERDDIGLALEAGNGLFLGQAGILAGQGGWGRHGAGSVVRGVQLAAELGDVLVELVIDRHRSLVTDIEQPPDLSGGQAVGQVARLAVDPGNGDGAEVGRGIDPGSRRVIEGGVGTGGHQRQARLGADTDAAAGFLIDLDIDQLGQLIDVTHLAGLGAGGVGAGDGGTGNRAIERADAFQQIVDGADIGADPRIGVTADGLDTRGNTVGFGQIAGQIADGLLATGAGGRVFAELSHR